MPTFVLWLHRQRYQQRCQHQAHQASACLGKVSFFSCIAFTLWSSIAIANAPPATKAPVLLTATLVSDGRQEVVAPLSDSWQIQVQWLKPEAEPVRRGDLIAVFNAGSSQSDVKRFKTELLSATELLKQQESEHQLLVMEARFELKNKQLLLEKASIDAAVPPQYQSRYDYEKFQLDYQKARTEAEKAQSALVTALARQQSTLAKQQLQIKLTQQLLAEAEQTLENMKVYANRDGAFSYSMHPWNGEKLFAGSTLQPGWQVAKVNSLDNLQIEAWVHEMDLPRLQQARGFVARFDVAPEQRIPLQLTALAAQGEKRQAWGNAGYYRALFNANTALPIAKPLLGLGLMIEVTE